jgi:hypothetical protein
VEGLGVPGNRRASTLYPSDSACCASLAHCDDLPALSRPSTTTKMPRFGADMLYGRGLVYGMAVYFRQWADAEMPSP